MHKVLQMLECDNLMFLLYFALQFGNISGIQAFAGISIHWTVLLNFLVELGIMALSLTFEWQIIWFMHEHKGQYLKLSRNYAKIIARYKNVFEFNEFPKMRKKSYKFSKMR